MFLACSLTRDFASTMEIPVAFEERHRINDGEMALGAVLTRIVATGSDMVIEEVSWSPQGSRGIDFLNMTRL